LNVNIVIINLLINIQQLSIGKVTSYFDRFMRHDIRAITETGFHYNEITKREENITIEQIEKSLQANLFLFK